MTQNLDEKIGQLLRADTIPERDPMFRIRVLERGERLRHRRRSQAILTGAVLLAVVPVVAVIWQDNPIVAGLAALLCVAAISASVVAVVSTVRVVRWLRAS
jgi:hypothetical protein